MIEGGIALAGLVSPPAEFRISYSAEPIRNSRYVDMAAWCHVHGIPFTKYFSPDDIAKASAGTGAVAALLAGWFHHVPAHVRRLFPRGCVGVHASLLPRYRGGAPLNWALLNGDSEAGVSLFELVDGIDEGPLYDQRRFPIGPGEYIADLLGKVEVMTRDMLRGAIPGILDGSLRGRAQKGEPSYSLQRCPGDGAIDWKRPAGEIARLVRSASRPYPGARTVLDDDLLIIWRARAAERAPQAYGAPGQIVRLRELSAPAVVTGAGLLLIEEIEGPNGFNLEALGRCHQRRLGGATL